MPVPISSSTVRHPGFGNAVAASLLFCLLVGLSTSAFAQSAEAREMLFAMAGAVRTLDYQGSLVYQHDGASIRCGYFMPVARLSANVLSCERTPT